MVQDIQFSSVPSLPAVKGCGAFVSLGYIASALMCEDGRCLPPPSSDLPIAVTPSLHRSVVCCSTSACHAPCSRSFTPQCFTSRLRSLGCGRLVRRASQWPRPTSGASTYKQDAPTSGAHPQPLNEAQCAACSSRHLVLVKTQTGTVYTRQEFKYEVIDTHSLLLRLPLLAWTGAG